MVVCHTPLRLMSIMVCQVTSEMSWAWAGDRPTPALAETMVQSAQRGHPLVQGLLQGGVVAHVGPGGDDATIEGLDPL